MTLPQSPQQMPHERPPEMSRKAQVALACIAAIGMGITAVVVNWQIYLARALFIAAHPDKVAQQPPTVSGAIADPAIGEPFAFWMAVCAPCLAAGVAAALLLKSADLRGMRHRGDLTPRAAAQSQAALVLFMGLQLVACAGMVILSHWRFPDFRDAHMAGSYMLFGGQGFVILLDGIMLRLVWRRGASDTGNLISAANRRLRARVFWVPVGLVLSYLFLFIFKDMVEGDLRAIVMEVYVRCELAVLSAYLLYAALYVPGMVGLLRRH